MRHFNTLLPRAAAPLLGALMFLGACASTSETEGAAETSHYGPVRIDYRDYRGTTQQLGIVNEMTVNRVEYYSNAAMPLGTKVASDEIVNVLVETFLAEDFWDYARPGKPPSSSRPNEAGQPLHATLAINMDGREGWTTIRSGLSADERESFATSVKAFVTVYNEIAAFQSVENPTGKNLFEQPKQPR